MITDSSAGLLMARGLVDRIIVGADRIAANGDVANKIGTYPLAVLARHHDIPFVVAAPTSTIDPATPTGADIPIEERDPSEVGPHGHPGRELRVRHHAGRARDGARDRGGRAGMRELATAKRPLIIGIGGGGDVVGALAIAEHCRLFHGANPIVGGVSWERRPIDPEPGPRRATRSTNALEIAPGSAGRQRRRPSSRPATSRSPSRAWPGCSACRPCSST